MKNVTECKAAALPCMQAHRKDSGDIYTLDLNDINNESRNFNSINKPRRLLPSEFSACHCDEAGVCDLLYERRSYQESGGWTCLL
mgnify:CR=1 FL=1